MEQNDAWHGGLGEVMKQFEKIHGSSATLLREIEAAIDSFLARLPMPGVSFLGGETSKNAYRVLCSFLLLFEAKKNQLQINLLKAAEMREMLARLYVRHTHDLLVESKKQEESDGIEDRATLSRLLQWTDRLSQLTCDFFNRFLCALNEASDAENDGKRCNIQKVVSLCGTLKQEVKSTGAELGSIQLSFCKYGGA